MSIFKQHKASAERTTNKKTRHKDKIKRAIREGVHHIVSDESIIGKNGNWELQLIKL